MAKPSRSTWLVYMLRCADGTLYTGITKDLARRCQQHNNGTASRYTRRRPVKLVYQEPQRNQSLALKREAAIKKLTRRQKLATSGLVDRDDHLREDSRDGLPIARRCAG